MNNAGFPKTAMTSPAKEVQVRVKRSLLNREQKRALARQEKKQARNHKEK